jgi:hypothetical protein
MVKKFFKFIQSRFKAVRSKGMIQGKRQAVDSVFIKAMLLWIV